MRTALLSASWLVVASALGGCGLAYDVGATGIDMVPLSQCNAEWQLCEPETWTAAKAIDALAADAGHLYLALDGGGTIVRLPRAIAGAPAQGTLVATGTPGTGTMGAQSLVSDGTRVYWIPAGGRTVLSAPVDGGPVETLPMPADALALGAGGLVLLSQAEHTIQLRAPSGEWTLVTTSGPGITSMAADARGIAWTEPSPSGQKSGVFYWRASERTTVSVADDQLEPHAVTVDGDTIYWMHKYGGMFQGSTAGGEHRSVLAGIGAVTDLHHDGAWMFWRGPPAESGTKLVAWRPGKGPEDERTLAGNASAYVRDGAELFWSSGTTVSRLAQ